MKSVRTVLLAILTLSSFACSVTTMSGATETLQEKMAYLNKETKILIGEANCSMNQQCHSIGFGHKPCGGFYEYRIYSDSGATVDHLIDRIEQYNILSNQLNNKTNLVSNCMMLVKPQLVCRSETCQIQ